MIRLIQYFNRHGLFVILPFFCYFIFKEIHVKECTDFEKYSFGLFFFFLLLFSNFYFVLYHTEKIYEHQENSKGRFKFLAHTLGIIFFLSLTFASYYWCLFNYDKSNFINVNSEYEYLDFVFYSFGTFIMNNASEIHANSIFAKLFQGAEMLTAFITLILILANYKDLKASVDK